jgi:predicted PurR-regulated permease PerM
MSVGVPELVVVAAIASMLLVVIWPACRICDRIGFSRWLGLVAIVPIANILLLWFVAMAPWPARRA